MKLLSFLLLFQSQNAFAQVPPPRACEASERFDAAVLGHGLRSGQGKACLRFTDLLREIRETAVSEARKANPGGVDTPTGEAGQAGSFLEISNMEALGADRKNKLASVVASAAHGYHALGEKIDKQLAVLADHAARALGQVSLKGGPREPLLVAHEGAKAEFEALKENTEQQATALETLTLKLRGDATRLQEASEETGRRGARLDGSEKLDGGGGPSSKGGGISDNTLLALGGAAVIGAGLVGGLYFVSQAAINKADEAAALRIAQAEAAANRAIKNAEETATRILQLARETAGQLIADTLEAGKEIVRQARSDVEALVRQLLAELKLDFLYLTDAGVKKLEGELKTLFDKLIVAAQKVGDKTLEANLRKAWSGVQPAFQEELARRRSTSTVTSTATGTATSTSTATDTRL